MIDKADVSMILVTRGDQPDHVASILDSWLDYGERIVWDNSIREDWKCAGRYAATLEAKKRVVMYQDDDVIVPRKTQRALLEAYKPNTMVANWGHGENPDGYDDLPLVCGGAIVDRTLPWQALNRYLAHYPDDDAFRWEADFVAGVLYENWEHVYLPFTINMEIAQHPSRLCNQPFQRDLKFDITQRARRIRDEALVAA